MPKVRRTAMPSKLALTVALSPGLSVVTPATTKFVNGGPMAPSLPRRPGESQVSCCGMGGRMRGGAGIIHYTPVDRCHGGRVSAR